MSGSQQFNALLERKQEPVFYAFDLLWRDGVDLQSAPLIERKHWLFQLVEQGGCDRLLYAQHIEQCGKTFFEEICSRDLVIWKGSWRSGGCRSVSRAGTGGSKSRIGTIHRWKGGK